MTDEEAIQWARGTVRAEMARRSWTYADLTTALNAYGMDENERNLRNKIARGTFSAAFFFQCMQALSVSHLDLNGLDIVKYLMPGRATNEEMLQGTVPPNDPEDIAMLEEVRTVLNAGEATPEGE